MGIEKEESCAQIVQLSFSQNYPINLPLRPVLCNAMASQADLCDKFVATHSTIRFGRGEWREYQDGIWVAIEELTVKFYVQKLIRAHGSTLSASLVNAIVELVRARVHIPSKLFDHNPHILIFDDCCLDLITYQKTPHSPTYYATHKLPFKYDPTAKSVAWEKAAERFPFKEFLQEFAGLCMTAEMKYEIAVWLHGAAGCGKSTFISGLEAALGRKACVLGLTEMESSDFALSQIPGKTLAISTEQPAHFIKCAHKLNALISGESITINEKYKAAYTLNPTIKLLWAMNELPAIPSGAGAGLFRRVYPLHWPALAEAERDPNIKEEIIRSGMAVVNWCLEGLKRLRTRGGFDIPDELKKARDDYKSESDVTLCYIQDHCDQADGLEVFSSKLYEDYSKWCEASNHKPFSSIRFSSELKRLGFEKVRKAPGIYWLGLDLKPEFPDDIVIS